MNRRFFMQALAASLGFFGLGKFVQAEEPKFRYSKFLRNCDQAMMDEFRDTVHLDDTGKAFKVPIIWATDDKAAAYIRTVEHPPENVNIQVKLPLMNLYRGDIFFNDKVCIYYHLTIHTLYEEDMNQILEQAIVKFHPKCKNKVGECNLMSMINNYYPGGSHTSAYPLAECNALRGEQYSALRHGKAGEWVYYKPEDAKIRVLKHQLNMILVCEGKP